LSLIKELKRRNVFKVAITYVVLAWLSAQVAELLLETFGAPDWVLKTLLMLLMIGFPFALFFAWAFELTPEGIKKEKDVDRSQSITPQTGRKLNSTIISVLVLALGYFAWDKFMAAPGQETASTGVALENSTDTALDSALPADKSIAVLPFDNRSNQEEDEFFTSGIHDDVLTQLAQISSLRVISRTSVAQFKGTTKSIHEIAELLGVATILEGGVQRSGNQVRINMQLIDAATDAHLWAQTFDRELTANNIFSIQSEIASAVTEAMRATLSPEEQQRISSVPTENMQALEEYFKGRAEMDQRTRPALESSRMRFEQARKLDPEFALAYAGEAQAILLLTDAADSYGEIPGEETSRLARPLLSRALELAPLDAQVLGIYGLLERNDYNIELALDYYRRSVALNPSSGEVLNWQRMAQFATGRVKEAVETNMRMVEIDPMSMITLFNGVLGIAVQEGADPLTIEMMLQRLEGLDKSYGLSARAVFEENQGNIPAAAKYYYMSLELDPGRSSNKASLASLLARLNLSDEALLVSPESADDIAFFMADWETAIQLARDNLDQEPESIDALFGLFFVLAMSGDAEKAQPLAEKLWERFGNDPMVLGAAAIGMSWVATKTEHAQQAHSYREAGAKWLQNLIEAGIIGVYRYRNEAFLAAIDGRDTDAINAIIAAIDRGARWNTFLTHSIFDHLKDDARFQAQVNRMNNLISSERSEVLAMLCGPETILKSWEPAANTCGIYRQETETSNG
jgi:TolB-like protein